MLNEFLVFVALPVTVGAIVFSVLWYFNSSQKYRDLPHTIARGLSGSKFLLTRGVEHGTSDFFYDIDLSISKPLLLKPIVDWYVAIIEKIKKDSGWVDKIAFIEKDSGPVGALMLAAILVEKTKIPAIIVRLRRRLLVNSLKGSDLNEGNRLILISDVLTSGGGIKKALEKLTSYNAQVRGAVVLVSRMNSKDIKDLEKKWGIPIFYAFEATKKDDFEQYPIKKFIEILKKEKEKRDPGIPLDTSISP